MLATPIEIENGALFSERAPNVFVLLLFTGDVGGHQHTGLGSGSLLAS